MMIFVHITFQVHTKSLYYLSWPICLKKTPQYLWGWYTETTFHSSERWKILTKDIRDNFDNILKFLEMQLLGMLTSRNFAGLFILTLEINSENFRSLSQILVILQNNMWNAKKSWSVIYRAAHKSELGHVTSPNLLGEVLSSISRHWPSFMSFWWVELKSAF